MITGMRTAWAAQPTTLRIDVGLLEEIEAVLAIDTVPAPDVILPLMRRREAQWRVQCNTPDDVLEGDIEKALDGEWLHLEEIAPIQRLRGWNRLRYGQITVKVRDLRDVSSVLGNIAMSLDGECDGMADEFGYPGAEDILAAVKAQMAKNGTCGECQWCNVRRLGAACDDALWNAGVELGLDYRYYVLGQPLAQANYEVYGYLMDGYDPARKPEGS